jgi:hypothetical protein
MPASDYRPHPRDSTARWQVYAEYLEAEAERLREALTAIARRGSGPDHAFENWRTARDAIHAR